MSSPSLTELNELGGSSSNPQSFLRLLLHIMRVNNQHENNQPQLENDINVNNQSEQRPLPLPASGVFPELWDDVTRLHFGMAPSSIHGGNVNSLPSEAQRPLEAQRHNELLEHMAIMRSVPNFSNNEESESQEENSEESEDENAANVLGSMRFPSRIMESMVIRQFLNDENATNLLENRHDIGELFVPRYSMFSNLMSTSEDARIDQPVRVGNPHRPVFNYNESVDDIKYSIDNEKYVDFANLQEQGLECPICLSVIKGTVAVTTCLHKFCSRCIYSHYTKCVSENTEPKCPMCRHDISIDTITLDNSLTQLLDSTIVQCKNAGCKEEIKRSEYNSHILNCKYDKKECKHCKSLFYDCDMKSHKDVCKMKTTKCNLCSCYILDVEYESHLRDKCPHSVVKCENSNCNYKTQRYKMSNHTNNNCHNRIVSCPDGCGLNFEIHYLSEHKKVCCNASRD